MKRLSYGRKHDGYFEDKAMQNFAFSLIPKGGKNAPSIYSALKAPILIRNDSITSEESKAGKKTFGNTLYVE